MNCKPGDLAIQVGTYGPTTYIGCLYECLSWYVDTDGEPRWRLRPLFHDKYRTLDECDDKFLRPIRPGSISDTEVKELYQAPPLPANTEKEKAV